MHIKSFVLAGLACLVAAPAMADCGIEAGSVRILSNDFPALHAVAEAAAECASPTVTVTTNATAEHKVLQVPALQVNPAQYSVAMIANSSIIALLNADLLQPLDALVAEYGQALQPNQLIKIDGQVMAIAFMGNAQHLFYRSDILEQAGVAVPKTYDDVLEAARIIKEKGILDYPLAGTYGAGWDLGEEFINMYTGMGGTFFAEGSAAPAINNDIGIAALTKLKALSEFMPPEYLSADANIAQADWEAGQAAMMVLWGSRASGILDDQGGKPEVVAATRLAAAPTAGGTLPATTLWWDGFALAKNISEADATASFRTMMHALSDDMANAHADEAAWLIGGATPSASSAGTLASADAGALAYPMTPYMGLLHTAIGNELAQFMQGSETAAEALSDAEASYTDTARAEGYLD